jgi:aminoglycoside 6'-N-acetyltransferase I
MRHALWPSADIPEHRLELTVALARKELRAFVAESSEGSLLGFAEASVRPYANGCDRKPVPFVEGVWVEEDFRRREVGRYLMEAVVTWARDAGYREIGSDCELNNTGSQAAHAAWGFEETERVVYYRRTL